MTTGDEHHLPNLTGSMDDDEVDRLGKHAMTLFDQGIRAFHALHQAMGWDGCAQCLTQAFAAGMLDAVVTALMANGTTEEEVRTALETCITNARVSIALHEKRTREENGHAVH